MLAIQQDDYIHFLDNTIQKRGDIEHTVSRIFGDYHLNYEQQSNSCCSGLLKKLYSTCFINENVVVQENQEANFINEFDNEDDVELNGTYSVVNSKYKVFFLDANKYYYNHYYRTIDIEYIESTNNYIIIEPFAIGQDSQDNNCFARALKLQEAFLHGSVIAVKTYDPLVLHAQFKIVNHKFYTQALDYSLKTQHYVYITLQNPLVNMINQALILEEFSNSNKQRRLIAEYRNYYLSFKIILIQGYRSVIEKSHQYLYHLLNEEAILERELFPTTQEYNINYLEVTRKDFFNNVNLKNILNIMASSVSTTFYSVKILGKTYTSINDWLNNTTDKYTMIDPGINVSKISTLIHSVLTNGAVDNLITQNGLDVMQSLIYAGIEKYDGEDELSWVFIKDAAFHTGQAVTINIALQAIACLVSSTAINVAVAGASLYRMLISIIILKTIRLII